MTDLRALLGDKYDQVIQKAADAMDEVFLDRALDVYPWLAPEAAAALAAVLPDLLAEANTRAEDAEAKARRFANMLANYNNEINATLPAEVVRQKAAAWDECTRAWEAYLSGTSDNVPPLNPYRQEQ